MSISYTRADRNVLKKKARHDVIDSIRRYLGTDHPVIIAAQANGHLRVLNQPPQANISGGQAQWGSPPAKSQME